jgi:hypothetical protein
MAEARPILFLRLGCECYGLIKTQERRVRKRGGAVQAKMRGWFERAAFSFNLAAIPRLHGPTAQTTARMKQSGRFAREDLRKIGFKYKARAV